jgi:hypothetical protein
MEVKRFSTAAQLTTFHPRLDVVGATVLIFEIVRVLPDVQPQDGNLALHQRAVLIRRRVDFKLLVGSSHEPGPARAEAP